MDKIVRKIIHVLRQHTPLWLHWKIGPFVAHAVYVFDVHVMGKKSGPKILSVTDTLDLIIKKNLSVIRIGDGEMSIMTKSDLGFQKTNEDLANRLKEIIKTDQEGLLICLPGLFGKLDEFAPFAVKFAKHHLMRYRHEWLNLVSSSYVYGNTFFTRPYLAYKESLRKNSGEIFLKLFSIWHGKHVVLIEGSKSRVGVGNDMFKDSVSVSRILCPAENAYTKWEEIFKEACKLSKDKLILLALGPAAKVIGFKLFLAGYRVIDIGHVDMEYEMYIRKESAQSKVRYKYFNEINERNPEECTDPKYIRQIIAKI